MRAQMSVYLHRGRRGARPGLGLRLLRRACRGLERALRQVPDLRRARLDRATPRCAHGSAHGHRGRGRGGRRARARGAPGRHQGRPAGRHRHARPVRPARPPRETGIRAKETLTPGRLKHAWAPTGLGRGVDARGPRDYVPGVPPKRIKARAALAQLVEHRIRNAGVGCSSHPGGTIFLDLWYYAALPRGS